MAKAPNSDAKKATIYVDVDDEITAIIDKLVSVPQKITALVLPKRAKVLQSIVSMRLLKRAADQHKKSLVLITTESGLMPLAAAVGVHVAKSLTSKPVIPEVSLTPSDEVATSSVDEPVIDPETAVGTLAAAASATTHAAPLEKTDEETVELDDAADEPVTSGGTSPKPKKDKKLAVPNFDTFRTRLLLAGLGLVLLGAFWYFATHVLPKATITIKTETSSASSTQEVTAIAGLVKIDADKKQVPLATKSTKMTQTDKFQATGQKDVGTKATGTMTVTNCINDGVAHTVPAGTTFSNGNYSFVTNDDLSLDPALFSGATCKSAAFGQSKDVSVTAANPGDSYNVSARAYTSSINGITGYGSAMSGGTSKMLKVVSDEDIDNAKKAILAKNTDSIKADLSSQLTKASILASSETFSPVAGTVITSIKSGEEATGDVTISVEVTYTMAGIANADISQLMKPEILKQIDSGKQQFVGDIAKSTKLKLTNRKSDTEMVFSASTDLTIGAKIEPEALKKQLLGMKQWDAERTIKALPGVKDASVKLSPLWVHNVPKKAGKITVITVNSDGKTSK